MIKRLFLLALLISGGCATIDPKTDFILGKVSSSGITDRIKTSFWSTNLQANEEKRGFSFEDEKVYWWGILWQGEGTLTAYWFAPDDTLFRKTKCQSPGSLRFFTFLPIKGEVPFRSPGQWRVEVRNSKEELIDRQKFYIGKSKDLESTAAENTWGDLGYDPSNAEAIMLLDEQHIEVMEEFLTKKTIHRKIKILNELGKRWADVYFPFFDGYEFIQVQFAHTILPNGKIIKTTEGNVVTYGENYPTYTAAKYFVMTMPAVEVGSIIEYEVTLKTNQPIAKGMFFHEFELTQTIPVIKTDLTIELPQTFELQIKNINTDVKAQISSTPQKKTKIYHWKEDHILPMTPEPLMPSYREIGSSIIVSTAKSWEEIADWWRTLTKGKDESDEEIKTVSEELIQGLNSEEEKLKRLDYYLKKNVRYVGLNFGTTVYEPQPARDVFKNKYGDCKDQSVLLLAMLKSLGLKADIALVRTNPLGPLEKEVASVGEFNHAIVSVEIAGNRYFLDPTAKYFAFGTLPYSTEGSDVMIIKEKEVIFDKIPRSDAQKNFITSNFHLNVKPDLNIDGEAEVVWVGEDNGLVRTFLAELKPEEKEKFVSQILTGTYPYAILKNYAFEHEEDFNQNLILKAQFRLDHWLSHAGNLIILKPYGDAASTFPAFLTENRIYPIKKNYLRTTQANILIDLPNELKVHTLPDGFLVENSLIRSSLNLSAGRSSIHQKQMIADLKWQISKDEYNFYRTSWEKISQGHQSQILLEKK